MFKKISAKKTGVFGICGCAPTGEFSPYAIHKCGLKFSGRLLGKYNALPKKSSCDDNKFEAAQAPFFTRKESVDSCCASNPCTDSNAVCTDVAITAENIFSESGFRCKCLAQYFDASEFQDGSHCVPRACDPGNAFDENLKACANIYECEGENTCHASAVCDDKLPL